MNADDYESLPTQSVYVHMMAGACAGIMEHCVMYGVDSVKTRRQILTPGPGGGGTIFNEIGNMMRQEGIFRPFRGIGAMVVGAGPAHAMYFSCYEFLKEKMMSTKAFPQNNFFSHMNNHMIYAYAGVVSTVLHDGVMNPAEVVKQRMQMPNSPYKTVIGCFKHVYSTEGIAAFYRSYRTTLVMNVPFQSIHFITYEFGQSITNPQRTYNPTAHVISGAMAGAVAATITMPLDVCKTLLNTQVTGGRATGMVDALGLVYRYWGLPGYFRGLSARIVYQMPATAICWSTYELFKYLLRDDSNLTLDVPEDRNCTIPAPSSRPAPITASPSVATASTATSSSFQGAGIYFNQKPPTSVLIEQ